MSEFVLGDYFDPLQDRLPHALISSSSLAKVRKFADDIPGEVSSFFGFECPVSDNAGTADFLFCSTQTEGHSLILAGQHRSVRLPSELLELPAWRQVRKFCSAWEAKDSGLLRQMLNIWLEFDIGQSSPPYSPSLFFGTSPELHADPQQLASTITAALVNLVPDAVEGSRGDTLQRILDTVPAAGGHVFQVGAMLSRHVPAIRICCRGIDAAQLIPTLQLCGWKADATELQRLISRYGEHCERIDFGMDVGESIGNKIGLECYFGRDQKTLGRMKAFLEAMIVDKLITKDKAAALYAFNGLEHQDGAPKLWSPHLQRLAALQGHDVINTLACWLHHVKLVSHGDNPSSAKAYLGVQADRMRRSDLRSRLSAVNLS